MRSEFKRFSEENGGRADQNFDPIFCDTRDNAGHSTFVRYPVPQASPEVLVGMYVLYNIIRETSFVEKTFVLSVVK